MFFGKPKIVNNFARQLVGEWHADAHSGDITNDITAIFSEDGSFLTRNHVGARGAAGGALSHAQAGRYRVEPVDKLRFRLFLIDENGAPLSATVRTFLDADTMVNEVGQTTFRRVPASAAPEAV
jgi:hypothetical protein